MLQFLARWPRLCAAWYALRGYQVAYHVKIENGGLVLDGFKPAFVYDVTITGPTLRPNLETGEARCPDGICAASGYHAVTVHNTNVDDVHFH